MTNLDPSAEGPPPTRRPSVLLVDDHEVGRRSLAKLLDAMGFDVTSVGDGESALEAVRTLPVLDYVLTDVRLPDLDGRDVVRVASGLSPTPRIALITGWDIEPDEPERLGIDWVFLKPLNVMEIVDKFRKAPPRHLESREDRPSSP